MQRAEIRIRCSRHQFNHRVSLARTSKLAKPKRCCYPFLSREIESEIFYICLHNP